MTWSRGWRQLLSTWIPIWGLYTLLIGPANPLHPGQSLGNAALLALRSISIAALLSLGVRRWVEARPWPRPMNAPFLLAHAAGAALFAFLWLVLVALLEQVLRPGAIHVYVLLVVPNMVLGAWLYLMIAGITYAVRATERAARAEALAARSQLAALRAQLNPHFLFNALHTVVQLVPDQPQRAAEAAEQLASLLRTTIEEDRDVVSVAEELAFVERYLAIEHLRFGARLIVDVDVATDAKSAEVPAFALQTLVENAVRHGAAPNVAPTTVRIGAVLRDDALVASVGDTGAGAVLPGSASGTGLQRLRDRLAVLYGTDAMLTLESTPGHGFTATLVIPQ